MQDKDPVWLHNILGQTTAKHDVVKWIGINESKVLGETQAFLNIIHFYNFIFWNFFKYFLQWFSSLFVSVKFKFLYIFISGKFWNCNCGVKAPPAYFPEMIVHNEASFAFCWCCCCWQPTLLSARPDLSKKQFYIRFMFKVDSG